MNEAQSEYQGKERRQHPRVPFWFVVTCRDVSGNIEPVSHFMFVYTRNISLGGILFESTQPFLKGSVLEFRLTAPTISKSLKIFGKVVRSEEVEEDLYHTAVSIIRMSDDDKTLLEKIIDEYAEKVTAG